MRKRKDLKIQNKTDIKIFILFLLFELNYPLDEAQLYEIVLENGYVGSFEFSECFSDLKEQGHILEKEGEAGTEYLISETGKLVAAELQGEILGSIREKSIRSAKGLLSLYRRGAVATATVKARPDHRSDVCCKITDADGALLEVTLAASDPLMAERIKNNFEAKPEEVYRGLLSVLTGEVDYLLR